MRVRVEFEREATSNDDAAKTAPVKSATAAIGATGARQPQAPTPAGAMTTSADLRARQMGRRVCNGPAWPIPRYLAVTQATSRIRSMPAPFGFGRHLFEEVR